MPDIGQIGPVCSDSNDHSDRRTPLSAARMPSIEGPAAGDVLPGMSVDGPCRDESVEDRARRIDNVRRAIAAGTYPSEEKLQVAMKRMLDELAN